MRHDVRRLKHRQCTLYVAVAVAAVALLSVLVHVLRRDDLGDLSLRFAIFLGACVLPFVLLEWRRLDPRFDCKEARDRQHQSETQHRQRQSEKQDRQRQSESRWEETQRRSRWEEARRRFEAQAESKRQAERRREDVRATAQERHRAEAEFASRHPEAAAYAHERFQQVVHAVRNMPTELWRPVEELHLADLKRYRAPVNVSALCQCSWAAAYSRAALFASGGAPP